MNRTTLWHHLQRQQPELVAVMTEVRRVFGRTPTPTIKLEGKVVWSPAIALREQRGKKQ